MSRMPLLCSLLVLVVGVATSCVRTHPGRVDSVFVAPVPSTNLADLRAVAVLADELVPDVVEEGYPEVYRVTGLQRAIREALAMSIGPAFASLEFAAEDPVDGYDVLLRPRVDLKVIAIYSNKWRVQLTVTATDEEGNLITESTALGEQGFFFLPDWSPAFRFALRIACQEVIAELAESLDRHFAS
jgi:hypothetical protein